MITAILVFFSLVISFFPFRPKLIVFGISSLSASFLLFFENVLASWPILDLRSFISSSWDCKDRRRVVPQRQHLNII